MCLLDYVRSDVCNKLLLQEPCMCSVHFMLFYTNGAAGENVKGVERRGPQKTKSHPVGTMNMPINFRKINIDVQIPISYNGQRFI